MNKNKIAIVYLVMVSAVHATTVIEQSTSPAITPALWNNFEKIVAIPFIPCYTFSKDAHQSIQPDATVKASLAKMHELKLIFDEKYKMPSDNLGRMVEILKINEKGAFLYQGPFNDNNLLEGIGGSVSTKGSTYYGQWKNGKREGLGIFAGARGLYIGCWKNDERNGMGVLVCADKIFEGKWTNSSLITDPVEIMYKDGGRYKGAFLNCTVSGRPTRHGEGAMVYPDGTKYVGSWGDDMRWGKGCLTDTEGRVIYDGNWRCDVPWEQWYKEHPYEIDLTNTKTGILKSAYDLYVKFRRLTNL